MTRKLNPRVRTNETDDEWAEIRASSRMRRTDESDELWALMVEKKRAYNKRKAKEWRDSNPERARDLWTRNNRKRAGREDWPAYRHNLYTSSQRNNHYKNRYGITEADVLRMAEEQGHRCKLCSVTCTAGQNGERLTFCVDHDHATGTVRGLLCRTCNVNMRAVDDDEWLARAIAYRDQHRGE